MRLPIFHWFLALAAFSPHALAQGLAAATSADPVYIAHVTAIDVATGSEAKDQIVVISGDRISDVRNSSDVKPPANARVVQAKGKFLIPGLWDMHVHAVFAERLDSMFPMFIANGVLGIRDMGTSMPLADVDRLRREIANGSRLGPRIIVAGPILDGRPKPLRANFLAITTPEQGRETVRSLKANGADFIKVYSWLSRDTFLAIADEAKKQNISFSGHVPFAVSALDASDAGQKSLDHLFGIYLSCSTREGELRAEMLKGGVNLPMFDRVRIEVAEAAASYDERKAQGVFARLLQNGTWGAPTFTAVLANSQGFNTRVTTDPRLKYIPPTVQEQWREAASAGNVVTGDIFEQMLRIGGAAHRAGVRMVAGTDSAWQQPYTYAGFSLHDELRLLVRAGLTPLEALRDATINAARYMGLEKDLGTIAKGKLGDMVLLDADPLLDIGNTGKIAAVIVNGRLLDRKALDALLAGAETDAKSK
jgi:imidazolonepropionase-like amidohydrolase